ncbi:hypothetical protein BCF59_0721 [Mycoplasmopsis mustelae]|uniref:Uncharacterized protein n=1 Tax=Mycoplasmopsis mustelae TaxID=171289 RepID=A0A4R7UE56_9BACT|nr:hypothetical protein [Mycoplasmopsis mustelae]TDV22872.1 hypothetical protein BCF59_0721 [Mycoplasmopsis mustelae]
MNEIISIFLFILLGALGFKFILDALLVRKYYLNQIIFRTTKNWIISNFVFLFLLLITAIILFVLIVIKQIIIKNISDEEVIKSGKSVFSTYHTWLYLTLLVFFIPITFFSLYYLIITKVNSSITDLEFKTFDKERLKLFSVDTAYLIIKQKRRKQIQDQRLKFVDYIVTATFWRTFSKRLYYKSILKRCIYFYLKQPYKVETRGEKFVGTNDAILVFVYWSIRYLNGISSPNKKVEPEKFWKAIKNLVK